MPVSSASRAQRSFARIFPRHFKDPSFVKRERLYKLAAHEMWQDQLSRAKFRRLLQSGRHVEVGARLLRVYRGLNLLSTFELMALTAALKAEATAEVIVPALFNSIYGAASAEDRFGELAEAFASVPVKRARLFTWPVQTIFPFLAAPETEMFLKPAVTRKVAEWMGFDLEYKPRPNWRTYSSLLEFSSSLQESLSTWKPRDLIDVQSFIWVVGSPDYTKASSR